MSFGALTREELETVLRDNAGWMFDGSLVKVQRFIEASQAILSLPLAEFDHAGERGRIEVRLIQENMDRALKWYANRRRFAIRGKTLYADLSNYRESGGGNDAIRQ